MLGTARLAWAPGVRLWRLWEGCLDATVLGELALVLLGGMILLVNAAYICRLLRRRS